MRGFFLSDKVVELVGGGSSFESNGSHRAPAPLDSYPEKDLPGGISS